MGLRNKEYQARISGMLYAYKIVKEKGVDELEKELKFRQAHFVPLEYTSEKIAKIEEFLKDRVIATMLPVIMYVLNDTFGFGRERLLRFQQAFYHRCEMMASLDPLGEPYERVGLYAKVLEKYGITFDLSEIDTVQQENDTYSRRYTDLNYIIDLLERKGYPAAAAELYEYSRRL